MDRNIKIIVLSVFSLLIIIFCSLIVFRYFYARNSKNSIQPGISVNTLTGKWENGIFTVFKNSTILKKFTIKSKPDFAIFFNDGEMIAYEINKTVNFYTSNGIKEVYKMKTTDRKDSHGNLIIEHLGGMQFSPDGRYLLINIWSWDFDRGIIFDTKLNKFLPTSVDFPFENLFWNINESCILNLADPGMYGPAIHLMKIDNAVNLVSPKFNDEQSFEIFFGGSNDSFYKNNWEIYWGDGCTGSIKNIRSKLRYSFEFNQGLLVQTKLQPNYIQALITNQQEITISN